MANPFTTRYLQIVHNPTASVSDGGQFEVTLLGQKNNQIMWLRSAKPVLTFADTTAALKTYQPDCLVQIAPLATDPQTLAQMQVDSSNITVGGGVISLPRRNIAIDSKNNYVFDRGDLFIQSGFQITWQTNWGDAFPLAAYPLTFQASFAILIGIAVETRQANIIEPII